VARVQATQPDGVSWLRIEANAGHGGADQVGKAIESSADQIGFLLETLK
jgi:prolyl oligopeptidase